MSRERRDQEELKRKAAEEEDAKKKAQIEEEAQRLAEEEKKRALDAKAAEEEEAKKKNPEAEQALEHITYRLLEPLAEDKKKEWKKDADDLVNDYKKQFPDREIDAKGTLVFHSEEEMTKFFTDQAEQKRKFLCAEVDANGKLTGRYQFSCGDGTLYSGTLEQIKEKIQENKTSAYPQQTAAGLAMINNLLNPKPSPVQATQTAKDKLKGLKDTAAAADESLRKDSPTPLSTTPNPLNQH